MLFKERKEEIKKKRKRKERKGNKRKERKIWQENIEKKEKKRKKEGKMEEKEMKMKRVGKSQEGRKGDPNLKIPQGIFPIVAILNNGTYPHLNHEWPALFELYNEVVMIFFSKHELPYREMDIQIARKNERGFSGKTIVSPISTYS
jgi:hypothetical protein